jgi:hypothetical protein
VNLFPLLPFHLIPFNVVFRIYKNENKVVKEEPNGQSQDTQHLTVSKPGHQPQNQREAKPGHPTFDSFKARTPAAKPASTLMTNASVPCTHAEPGHLNTRQSQDTQHLTVSKKGHQPQNQ